MSMEEYNQDLREEFIEALITFSEGGISEEEAKSIADRELRCSDYYEGSPLAHKGPRWQALRKVRELGYTKYPD